MPAEQCLNFVRSAGMNRAEQHDVDVPTISRHSKHDFKKKMKKNYLTDVLEKAMLDGAGFFTDPIEVWWLGIAFIKILFYFIDKHYSGK